MSEDSLKSEQYEDKLSMIQSIMNLEASFNSRMEKMSSRQKCAEDAFNAQLAVERKRNQQLRDELSIAQGELKDMRSEINSLKDIIRLQEAEDEKLDKIDKKINRVNVRVTDQSNDIMRLQKNMEKSIASTYEELRGEMFQINEKMDKIPSSLIADDVKVQIKNGDVDISPLIRAIYRDARRLDGFNELIGSMRKEIDGVVNSLAGVQNNMHKLQVSINDLVAENQKQRNYLRERLQFSHVSVHSLEKGCIELWKSLQSVSLSLNHAISNMNQVTDDVQTMFTMVSNRPLPSIQNMTDVLLEAHTLKESISEKLAAFEGERDKFADVPYDDFVPINIPAVEAYVGTSCTENIDSVSRNLIEISIEENRQRINTLSSEFTDQKKAFDEFVHRIDTTLLSKADSATVDRLFDKAHRAISSLSSISPISSVTPKTSVTKISKEPKPMNELRCTRLRTATHDSIVSSRRNKL